MMEPVVSPRNAILARLPASKRRYLLARAKPDSPGSPARQICPRDLSQSSPTNVQSRTFASEHEGSDPDPNAQGENSGGAAEQENAGPAPRLSGLQTQSTLSMKKVSVLSSVGSRDMSICPTMSIELFPSISVEKRTATATATDLIRNRFKALRGRPQNWGSIGQDQGRQLLEGKNGSTESRYLLHRERGKNADRRLTLSSGERELEGVRRQEIELKRKIQSLEQLAGKVTGRY